MGKRDKMNEQQKAFADYYLINNNAGESYKMAYDPTGERGIAQSTCYANGSKLLKMDKVKNYMSDKRTLIQSDRILTAQEVLEHLTLMATDLALKPSDRIKALELLGKKHILFTDKTQIDGDMEIDINLTGVVEEEE